MWLTSRDNAFFARAAVNWAWSHLFGRRAGRVARSTSTASADAAGGKLLDELAEHFVDSGFDLQQLWRTLASTRAYQLSSRHDDAEAAPPELFARMLPKPLTPEQLYDSFVLLAPSVAGAARATRRPASLARSLDEDPTAHRVRPPHAHAAGRARRSTAPARCRR